LLKVPITDGGHLEIGITVHSLGKLRKWRKWGRKISRTPKEKAIPHFHDTLLSVERAHITCVDK
jgi:hypothetical protein